MFVNFKLSQLSIVIVVLYIVFNNVGPVFSELQTSSGGCSPNIGVNLGTITLNCGVSDEKIDRLDSDFRGLADKLEILNRHPTLVNYNENIKEQTKLKKTVLNLEKTITSIEKSKNENVKKLTTTIGKLKKQLLKQEVHFRELRDKHSELIQQLPRRFDHFFTDISQYITDLEILKKDEGKKLKEKFELQIIRANNKIEGYSNAIMMEVSEKFRLNNKKLNAIENRISKLETKVSFLMKEFHKGNLRENIGFYGLSIGGVNINGTWHPKMSLKYEFLFPHIPLTHQKGGLFIELTHLDWEESFSYKTLPGLPKQTFNEDNKFTYLAIGSTVFIGQVGEISHTYVGAHFGHAIEGAEDPFVAGLILGVEFLKKSIRLAFELQGEMYSDIRARKVKFRPFGDANIETRSEDQYGLSLNIRVMFR